MKLTLSDVYMPWRVTDIIAAEVTSPAMPAMMVLAREA